MKTMAPLLFALIALGTSGCGGAAKVYITPDDATARARPAGCAIEYLFERPARRYEELGDLQSQVTTAPKGGAWTALGPQACALGADAVIVTRNQVLNMFEHTMVEGTAIRFIAVPVVLIEAEKVPGPPPDATPTQSPPAPPGPTQLPPPPPSPKPGG